VATHWIFAGILALLLSGVAFATVQSGLLLRRWLPPHNLLLSWPDNLLRLLLVAGCLVLGLTIGPGPAALTWATGSFAGDLLLGLISGSVLAAVLGLSGALAIRRWGGGIYSDRMLQCILPLDRREWVGVLPALLVAAALEELLFRWLPLAGLAWLIAPEWLMWPLAVFFGLLHWPQGSWGVVGTTLAAVMLSLLFLLTGSIWPPLIAHYVMNVSQLILAKWTGVKPLRGKPEINS
jgi:membrane protease YdiL (CAAX protease family)